MQITRITLLDFHSPGLTILDQFCKTPASNFIESMNKILCPLEFPNKETAQAAANLLLDFGRAFSDIQLLSDTTKVELQFSNSPDTVDHRTLKAFDNPN